MSLPDYEQWLRDSGKGVPLAGDPHDDDAQYIDQLVEQNANPVERPTTVLVSQVETKPKVYGRLLSGFYVFNVGNINQILQVLPADENRKHLVLEVFNGGASNTASVFLADSSPKLANIQNDGAGTVTGTGLFFRFSSKIGTMTLDDYTGPLWLNVGPSIAGEVQFTYVAVTS